MHSYWDSLHVWLQAGSVPSRCAAAEAGEGDPSEGVGGGASQRDRGVGRDGVVGLEVRALAAGRGEELAAPGGAAIDDQAEAEEQTA